jgi:hypothetical protein
MINGGESEMTADEIRLARPLNVPCMGRTLHEIMSQVGRCSNVHTAWFSTLSNEGSKPKLCAVIALKSEVPDEDELLRSIVDPLQKVGKNMAAQEVHDPCAVAELNTCAWFVADNRMQTELSQGAGIVIYRSPE